MGDKAQQFIETKKRKKLRKKIIITLFLLVSIALGITFKASFFNISTVSLIGNNVLDKKKVFSEKDIIGQNIFLFNQKKLESFILGNSYIKSVSIKKELPDKLTINIDERKMLYKIKEGNKYYILNKSLVLMDIKQDITGLSLIELKGIKIENKKVGETIVKDERKVEVAEVLSDNNILEDKSIDSLEINSINNIVLNKGEVKIILGNTDDLEEKYKKAINVLNSKDFNLEKGYIDVSFNGNPVIREAEENRENQFINIENENIKNTENVGN